MLAEALAEREAAASERASLEGQLAAAQKALAGALLHAQFLPPTVQGFAHA